MSPVEPRDLPREKYLSRIRPFYHDHDLIKVITGVRGSGKSTIPWQIADELQSDSGASVVHLDLDPGEYAHVDTSQDVQVAYLMESSEAVEREVAPLLRIRDAYPKYVISMDPVGVDVRGFRHLNLLDFLLGDGFRLGPE